MMHELSIAVSLVEQIEEIAKKNQLSSIEKVEIETGVLRQVIPEIMQTAFTEASAGTIASGIALGIKEKEAVARCLLCDCTFEPETDNFTCDHCGRAEVEILQGDQITFASLTGHQ